jgi:predicted NAD-dependent protein-ADP-ribosyltransferase YbiA (DUF1768 family)
MTVIRIAIIGTAGRGQYASVMTKDLFEKMVSKAEAILLERFSDPENELIFVSGGAAWSDHVAVALAKKIQARLTLYLPCPLVNGRFEGLASANTYHEQFSAKMGFNSLEQLQTHCALPSTTVHVYNGFHERNRAIAAHCDFMIAFSWSNTDEPVEGGTLYTWSRFHGPKVHVSLGSISMEHNGPLKSISFYDPKKPFYEFSNFYDMAPFELDGKRWATVEHYFQAQKFPDCPEYQEIIRTANTANKAFMLANQKKKYGYASKWYLNKDDRRLINDLIDEYQQVANIRQDWDDSHVKRHIMRNAVFAKFSQNPRLGELLISTGDANIVEDSPRDWYWGVGSDGTGKNRLGKILVRVRTKLRSVKRAQGLL